MYKYLLRKKIKNILQNSERKKAYLNLNEIKSILVLFDTENFDDANQFILQMKEMGKQTNVLAFKSKKDSRNYDNTSYVFVTGKDMRELKGDSLVRIINSLTDEPFDLIVNFTLKENLLLLYVLVSTKSPLKVGFYKHDLPFHDIVISFAPGLAPTVKELGEQLVHYLTVISSGAKK